MLLHHRSIKLSKYRNRGYLCQNILCNHLAIWNPYNASEWNVAVIEIKNYQCGEFISWYIYKPNTKYNCAFVCRAIILHSQSRTEAINNLFWMNIECCSFREFHCEHHIELHIVGLIIWFGLHRQHCHCLYKYQLENSYERHFLLGYKNATFC